MTEGKVLVLRTCSADMTSYNGFRWPESGPVECPDWEPTAECGNGLHGLLWGEGDGGLLSWSPDAKWLVVEVAAADIVTIDAAKVKFPRGVVIYAGTRYGATRLIAEHAPVGSRIVGLIAAVPDNAHHDGADRATVSGGYHATVSGGDGATVSGGYRATVSGGDGATVSGGTHATVSGGYRATVSGGDGATTLAGHNGTAKAGDKGIVAVKWWDTKADRFRLAVGYVGEDGIEANVPYRADANGRLVKVD